MKHFSSLGFLRHLFLIFFIPVLELGLSRYLITLHFPFVSINIIVLPAFCALAAFFYAMKKNHPITLSFQKKTFALNLIAFAAFLVLSLNLQFFLIPLGAFWLSILWLTLGLLTLCSSLFIFISLRDFDKRLKIYEREALFGILAGSSFLFSNFIIDWFWPYLSRLTNLSVYALLRLSGFQMIPISDPFRIQHPHFSAYIGAPCSGLEGIFFFFAAFSFVLIFDWRLFSKRAIAGIYLAGVIYMFLLNVLRIAVFFIVAIWMTQKGDKSQAVQLFIWAFHSHIGWIFYLIGINIFFAFMFKFQSRKKPAIPT